MQFVMYTGKLHIYQQLFLDCALSLAAHCIVIGPVLFVCLFVCGFVCLFVGLLPC